MRRPSSIILAVLTGALPADALYDPILPRRLVQPHLTYRRRRLSLPSPSLVVYQGLQQAPSERFSASFNDANHDEAETPQTDAVTILHASEHYVVVAKPPSVVCHHSDWSGSRSRLEVPMLQRTRDALGGRRVNLIHRLDRGCSGCLLMAFADTEVSEQVTAELSAAMSGNRQVDPNVAAARTARKTYVALVRGEGILHGRNFGQEGWFCVDRPIKNERGVLHDAVTWFRFVACQDNAEGQIDRPRASLVLARPITGRWHQIRRHLNGLSHPILGDSSHGNSHTNREWREKLPHGLWPERTCLHLARLQLGPTPHIPDGVDVSCPLAQDMLEILKTHLPNVLKEAEPKLQDEGIVLEAL